MRGDYRAAAHARHAPTTRVPPDGTTGAATCAAARAATPTATCARPPGPRIGTLHGLAGTGAVVLLLIAALPTQLEAAAALACSRRCRSLSMAL